MPFYLRSLLRISLSGPILLVFLCGGQVLIQRALCQQTSTATEKLEEARAHSYGGRPAGPLDACAGGCHRMYSNGWAARMPSLPGERSDVVAMGTPVTCDAHLSSDRTTIYTECVLVLDRSFKNSTENRIQHGSRLVITREGGQVSANGRNMSMFVADQILPQPGKEYIFFLKYRKATEDYGILTAYRVDNGIVNAVDDAIHFQGHNGTPLDQFIARVQSSIKDESPYLLHQHPGGAGSAETKVRHWRARPGTAEDKCGFVGRAGSSGSRRGLDLPGKDLTCAA